MASCACDHRSAYSALKRRSGKQSSFSTFQRRVAGTVSKWAPAADRVTFLTVRAGARSQCASTRSAATLRPPLAGPSRPVVYRNGDFESVVTDVDRSEDD